jgi:hypothetical protein
VEGTTLPIFAAKKQLEGNNNKARFLALKMSLNPFYFIEMYYKYS